MRFNLSLRPPHQLRIKEPGERKERQAQYGMKAITSSSDHQQLLLEKLNARQSTVGGAMWLKKWSYLWQDCNYCTATSNHSALSDSHCPLLCTSHPGKTNIHEQNI